MAAEERKIRVLIGKVGFDPHDRGILILSHGLRNAGMEVIYTGLRQTPEMIAETALQEDVNVVGLSILSGAHMTLAPKIVSQLKENELDDMLVVIGGIIPEEDVEPLQQLGVDGVFGPGTTTNDIVDFIRQNLPAYTPA